MKYKKFKYKGYKAPGSMSTKKRVLIIIAIILAVLVVAAAVVAIVLTVNENNQKKLNEEITNIQIVNVPHKNLYYVDEAFDATGLRVFANMKGGAFVEVNVDDCTITGFDSSVAAKAQKITVTYKGFTAAFDIAIKEEEPTIPMLESIIMETLPKTEYKKGEGLYTKGGVILCTYTDGTTKKVDLINEYIYGFRVAYLGGPGEYDITVKYTEDGIQAETTYKITISE